MEDLTGKQLGAYHIVAPLGEGGMAAVYKAVQTGKISRQVAIKVLPQHLAKSPEFVKRFDQEANVLAGLQYPRILPVFDFGETDGYTYLVMPFIESAHWPMFSTANHCRFRRSAAWEPNWPRRSTTPTRAALCIAMSSPATSWSMSGATAC